MRLIITAGYNRSKAAIALCELLTRQGHEVHSVIVITPFSYRRLKRLLLNQGYAGLQKAIGKLRPQVGRSSSLLEDFLVSEEIHYRSLKSWCKQNEANFVSVKSINSKKSIDAVKSAKPDSLIYAGGGILRKKIIAASSNNVLNCHSGPLPEIRGMNAIEWAVLLDQRSAVTIHKIDQGIDTGEIVRVVDVPILRNELISDLRERALIMGLKELIRILEGVLTLDALYLSNNDGATAGRQCYVMAPAISELLRRKLSGNTGPSKLEDSKS